MADQLLLGKNTIGVGDRFAHQAEAQLRACVLAAEQGIEVLPVWNKSNREHNIIGSEPASIRAAADAAVLKLGWTKPYYIDADHINFDTVERFLAASDFYTIDVADWIGKPASEADAQAFIARHHELAGRLNIPGASRPAEINSRFLQQTTTKYLAAVKEAGRIYRKIEERKGKGSFIPEVSMDETDSPQTPAELLIILAAIADEGIPVQTIAPKFTGRFNKGVDYQGDVQKFSEEFADDIATIAFAVKNYDLPGNLKLSVHSGSDKFSIYRPMRQALRNFDAGVHLKTAGTTWLEELIGLAEAGGDGLALSKEVYAHAFEQREALCGPYASVISIDPAKLPAPDAVSRWTPQQFVSALRHEQRNPEFNSDVRQLLHVGFKVAAKLGTRYLRLLETFEPVIAKNVTGNLFERHIRPLFLG
ncbi:MAG TPA: tagaturonate epimerase family protein [Bryobacteraceae bacterium]|nr:tagaturonate epimerase family protein [Bryobacteraceae bacterium]